MDAILRGRGEWEEAIARALSTAERPIPIDPRFGPSGAAGRGSAARGFLARYDRASFPPARLASTLLAVYPGDGDELVLPLTVRRPDLRAHAGEVSLPGGSLEPGDPDREAAALREAQEEIGLDPRGVTVLGTLDDVWIPVTNFELRPFVAAVRERPGLVPQAAEVAAIVELPLRWLLAPGSVTEEEITVGDWSARVGVYRYEGVRIWGATARTLAMLAAALTAAGITG